MRPQSLDASSAPVSSVQMARSPLRSSQPLRIPLASSEPMRSPVTSSHPAGSPLKATPLNDSHLSAYMSPYKPLSTIIKSPASASSARNLPPPPWRSDRSSKTASDRSHANDQSQCYTQGFSKLNSSQANSAFADNDRRHISPPSLVPTSQGQTSNNAQSVCKSTPILLASPKACNGSNASRSVLFTPPRHAGQYRTSSSQASPHDVACDRRRAATFERTPQSNGRPHVHGSLSRGVTSARAVGRDSVTSTPSGGRQLTFEAASSSLSRTPPRGDDSSVLNRAMISTDSTRRDATTSLTETPANQSLVHGVASGAARDVQVNLVHLTPNYEKSVSLYKHSVTSQASGSTDSGFVQNSVRTCGKLVSRVQVRTFTAKVRVRD